MATTSNNFCINKMTVDEAAKISAEKTRVELEKLQKTIKDTSPFEHINKMKTPSDIESFGSSCNSDNAEEINSHPTKRKRITNIPTMEDRMYSDNQKLWKKNQELKLELERTGKQLRYLQFEHNNKCIEISNLNNKMIDYSSMRSICFYARLNTLMCYIVIISMIAQFVYEYPVIDYAKDLMNYSFEIASEKVIDMKNKLYEYKNR